MEAFLSGRVRLFEGDARERLAAIPDASIDSVVTDPPYALVSIGKRFGKAASAPAKDYSGSREGATGAYARASAGFMGQAWDTGETAFAVEFWAEVLRVLKPGGHVVAFSGTRTYHRMVVAIEDAGFEIRDQIGWLYGSGFPKSHDVAKGIDKAAGAERAIIGARRKTQSYGANEVYGGGPDKGGVQVLTAPATAEAEAWQGWGTALKPAWEPIVLARKPLAGTVAETVLEHGTGALNIDGCRVPAVGGSPSESRRESARRSGNAPTRPGEYGHTITNRVSAERYFEARAGEALGRWPANVVHDGSDDVVAAFPDAPGQQRAVTGDERAHRTVNAYGEFAGTRNGADPRGDAGSAARFFYSAKADADDRLGSKHPTVKPVDLMQWLCRLVTPPGGTVLDPFAGTGTTGEAAWREGFSAVLIEREAAYCGDIRRRMALCLAGPDQRKREALKANGRAKGHDDLPLFGGEAAE